ncbi:MAG: VCBS repeat-containing protein [Desulfovermiculus sp.]|nr:VCBS repeat-containing protein [Desulfovermiculus sp.]
MNIPIASECRISPSESSDLRPGNDINYFGGEMNFRKSVFALGAILLFTAGPGLAQDLPKTFAVRPIIVHGPEKYRYLEQGIASMLTSRLTWEGHLEPVQDESELKTSAQVGSQKEAERVLQGLDADALFWGSVTITGDSASLDISSLDAREDTMATYTQSAKVADIIPALEDVVDSIHADMFQTEAEQKTDSRAEEQTAQTLNTQFVQEGMTSQESGGQSGLNPSFEYQTGAGQDQGRWQSQALSFTSTGMIVDDADNDGKQEIFLLSEHRVEAYTYKEHRLVKLDSFEVPNRVKLLNINALDMDRDRLSEIVVSGIFTDTARSYILGFRDKKFKVLQADIDLFFNVIDLPPNFTPRLIAQKHGRQGLFAASVHEAVKMDDTYQLGNKLSLPSEANVFNFVYLPLKDGGYKTIVADPQDRLRVYSKTNDRQYRTDENFGASGLGLEMSNVVPGMGESRSADLPKQFYYIPTRLLVSNLDGDDQFELLVNQSESVAADFFPRYRHFPQGRIHYLNWDGVGLNTVWKTRTIKGTVVDYGIGDPNNDGQDDLYVCVNTHPGAFGTGKRKTIVLAYALNIAQEGEKE